MTIHWIDFNFVLHQELLAFEQLSGRHSRLQMATILFKLLIDYEITEKLFCITTNNASANGTLCKHLQRMLREIGVS